MFIRSAAREKLRTVVSIALQSPRTRRMLATRQTNPACCEILVVLHQAARTRHAPSLVQRSRQLLGHDKGHCQSKVRAVAQALRIQSVQSRHLVPKLHHEKDKKRNGYPAQQESWTLLSSDMEGLLLLQTPQIIQRK